MQVIRVVWGCFLVVLIAIAGIFMLVKSAQADVPKPQKAEVAHLLLFVANTNCVVIRNGDEHKGPEAVKHIKKKYKHFKKKIDSTEDFIRLSASKSTMSGKAYQVKCPTLEVITTEQWLLKELAAFRVKQVN